MDDKQQKIRTMIEKARFAMFTTTTAQGTLESRPMTLQEVGDDFDLLFVTQRSSDVTRQADGRQVNLAFADGTDFVSLSGVAQVRDDVAKKQELWNPANDAYTEGGAENPDNVILAVRADSASYWDSPAAPVTLIQMATSLVTGKKPGGGEHDTVDL